MSKGEQQVLVAIKELESILESCKIELTPLNEVWPNLYIGNMITMKTPVYYGFPAEDLSHFDLSQYFKAAADFIHKALKTKDGVGALHHGYKLFGHAGAGVPHWCCCLLLRNTLKHVSQRRAIYSNRHFLETAPDKAILHSLGITHIVNAAHGPPIPSPGPCFHVDTGPHFYRDMSVDYYGVEAEDATEFVLSPLFYPMAHYIRAALAKGGRVFVHCLIGVSRSAALVLAFLMIVEGLTLQEAVAAVRPQRNICPNTGFLLQLDLSLAKERTR
ncbi:unnamed protein product [Coregonus sp. 'balchen']|nr:unnamed protein product [Coregonus sp. 'balchen']